MSSLLCNTVTALILISRRPRLPSTSELEVKPVPGALMLTTPLPWLHLKPSPCSELRGGGAVFMRCQGEASSGWTRCDISTRVGCRESTCTSAEHRLLFRKKTALTERVGQNGAVTDLKEPLGSTGPALLESWTHLKPEDTPNYLKKDCVKTLRAWTGRDALSYLRVRLKPSCR